MTLVNKVKAKIKEIGPTEASKFFGVSIGTISNWMNDKTPPSIMAAELVMSDGGFSLKSEAKAVLNEDSYLTMWQGKKLFIALPVYRALNPETHFTLFANYAKYGPDKIGMQVLKRTLIHEGRNILADKFLQTDAETMIMVDDDMILPCGNAAYLNFNHNAGLPPELAGLNTISRLMSHGRDKGIVGSLYFGRHRAGKAQCASGFKSDLENAALHKHEYSGLKQEDWVGTGCIKIERWVLEKMRKHIDAGEWPELKPEAADRWYGYFTPLKVGVGEDVSFGVRCKKIGIQSYIDASLECLHMGDQSFHGRNTSYAT